MFFLLGTGMQGKTLGIVGLGQIGTATARRARAFGMEIAYTGRRRADAALEAELEADSAGVSTSCSATADVVSLHCPLNAETRHLIDARRLPLMKPTRTSSTRPAARSSTRRRSSRRCATGTIAGAGLDVFEREPRGRTRGCSSSRTPC